MWGQTPENMGTGVRALGHATARIDVAPEVEVGDVNLRRPLREHGLRRLGVVEDVVLAPLRIGPRHRVERAHLLRDQFPPAERRDRVRPRLQQPPQIRQEPDATEDDAQPLRAPDGDVVPPLSG